jgi:hypothetical protein
MILVNDVAEIKSVARGRRVAFGLVMSLGRSPVRAQLLVGMRFLDQEA